MRLAEDATLDIGDIMQICIEDAELPVDDYECDGEELANHIVTTGDNCYDISVQYEVNFADIYNSTTGRSCSESDTWDVNDVLRICKPTVEPPTDDYVCEGTDLGTHTVASGDNCDALSIRFDVGYAEIFNVNTGLTCSQSSTLQIDDELRICKGAAVSAVVA